MKPEDFSPGFRRMSDGEMRLTRLATIITPEDRRRRLHVGERLSIEGRNGRVVARETLQGEMTVVVQRTGGKRVRYRESQLVEHG